MAPAAEGMEAVQVSTSRKSIASLHPSTSATGASGGVSAASKSSGSSKIAISGFGNASAASKSYSSNHSQIKTTGKACCSTAVELDSSTTSKIYQTFATGSSTSNRQSGGLSTQTWSSNTSSSKPSTTSSPATGYKHTDNSSTIFSSRPNFINPFKFIRHRNSRSGSGGKAVSGSSSSSSSNETYSHNANPSPSSTSPGESPKSHRLHQSARCSLRCSWL